MQGPPAGHVMSPPTSVGIVVGEDVLVVVEIDVGVNVEGEFVGAFFGGFFFPGVGFNFSGVT